ncbi:MAG: MarR family transcriptional regulator [bacterium]|nr:MarR family transcriptional regulator [bacterium]
MFDHVVSSVEARHAPDPAAMYAAGNLATAVRRLAERLDTVARDLHAGDDLTVSERGLLLALRQGGEQTIPQLAVRRGATRQYVQQALGPLAARGLVEWRVNPRHRRSRLAVLSPTGAAAARRVMAREGRLMERVAATLPREQALAATAALAAIEMVLAPALAAALAAETASGAGTGAAATRA